MKKVPFLIAAGACFAAAAFFRFALVGYSVMALLLAAAGVCVLLYTYLPKKFRIMLTILLVVGLVFFAVGEVPVVCAAGGTPDFDADYLIVLGAGVRGAVPSLSMANRMEAAKAYLDAHPGCVAVLSGGQGAGEDISEAEAMFRWLRDRGFPESRILLEDRSTNTEENIRNSAALIPDTAHQRIAVCSSEYHLYRAQYFGRRMGLELGAIAARTPLPVLRANYFIREGFGSLYYHIFA